MDDAGRRGRAEARRGRIVLRKGVLSRVEPDLDPIRGEAAISLLTRLSRESWSLTGRPVPSYERHRIPFRFVPRGAP